MAVSWVTVVWSMIASACLTLAAIYFFVWIRNRSEHAHLMFSINAASLAAWAICELWMMRAATPDELMRALRWAHVPLFSWLVSTMWFVRVYLRAGRGWLAWTILIIRVVMLIFNFEPGKNLTFQAALPLQRIQFLGEPVTVPAGVVNPWQLVTQATVILILVFVADAGMTAWRRGDRRKALIVGGSVEFSLVTAFVTAAPVTWGVARAPYIFSLPYMCLVLVMGYELSRGVLRASQLVEQLRASEAGLRENQARLQASNLQISNLAGRLIASQEVERARIARDLHDDLSQQIAGLSIALSALKHRLAGLDLRHGDELSSDVSSLQQRTAGLASNIRNLSHELHPSVLRHAGLVPALAAYCADLERQQQITITFAAEGDFASVSAEAALCLYRITQEALRNVLTHAQATRADVRLRRIHDRADLTIVDDGRGFDIAEASRHGKGLGLVSIDERVRLAGGTVSIVTETNSGTRVHVQIPANVREPETPRA
jgi:signal transduction histidine kinase